jgi:hypothetical protein
MNINHFVIFGLPSKPDGNLFVRAILALMSRSLPDQEPLFVEPTRHEQKNSAADCHGAVKGTCSGGKTPTGPPAAGRYC